MTANVLNKLFGQCVPLVILSFCLSACNDVERSKMKYQQTVNRHFVYKVSKAKDTVNIDADWVKPAWQDIPAIELKNWMGHSEPHERPQTKVKLLYDDDYIYVIFQVEERYIKCVRTKRQSDVHRDSCVEFFFTPKSGIESGYFNLEINCGGTMLFRYRNAAGEKHDIESNDCDKIKLAHSMPAVIPIEIISPTVWTLEYRIPIATLGKYLPADKPSPGVKWRANFYKCAGDSSHPHYMTWAQIDYPIPNFHLPQFFGTLEFGK